jgi:hypothetical protein
MKLAPVYRQAWPERIELCPECGQPDNCGDCNHGPLTHDEVRELGGAFVPLDSNAIRDKV